MVGTQGPSSRGKGKSVSWGVRWIPLCHSDQPTIGSSMTSLHVSEANNYDVLYAPTREEMLENSS